MKTSRLSVVVAALIGTASIPFSATAAVVDSGVLNVPVIQNPDGIYYNVITNANGGTAAAVPGWDLNFYEVSAASGLTFFWPTAGTPPSSGGVATGLVYSNLAVGSTVSAASTYSNAAGSGGPANFVNFITAGPKTLGFRFRNETGATIHYGYVNITTSGPLGFPAVITRIVYDNVAGTAVTVAGLPVGGAAIVAATAPGNITLTQALPAATSTSTLAFNVTGAASSITCAATGAGYSVAPATAVPLAIGTPGSVTVTYTGSAAGAFTGTVTCTGAAGSTGGPFVYNYTTNVTAGASTITAATAPGSISLNRTLPASTSTSLLGFSVTGGASSITCATTSAGYSVTPATAVPLVVGTPGSVTVTQTGSTAGAFAGTVTCTGGAGSTGGPFVYNFTTNVSAGIVTQVPALNTWGAMFLLLGVGLLGAFSVRRFS